MSQSLQIVAQNCAQSSEQAYALLVPSNRPTAIVLNASIVQMRSNSDEEHLRYIVKSEDDFHEACRHEHEAEDGMGIDAFQLNFNQHDDHARRGWTVGRADQNAASLSEADFVLASPTQVEGFDVAPVHAIFDMHPISGLITLKNLGFQSLVIVWENGATREIRQGITYTCVNRRTCIRFAGLEYILIYQVPRHDRDLQMLVKARDSLLDTLYPAQRESVPTVTRGLFPPKDGYPISGSTYICRTLACGGFGTVSVAINRDNANVVAVKKQLVQGPQALRSVLQEYHNSSHFQRVDNLLAPTDKWLEPGCHSNRNDMRYPAEISISMPLMLTDFERFKLLQLDRRDFANVFWQIMTGICEMHDRGFMHRDVTLANMAIASRKPLQAKLIDYGNAKKNIFGSSHPCGPHPYNAPKIGRIARGETHIPYTNAVDVWSWGYSIIRALGLKWTSPDHYVDKHELERIEAFLVYQEAVIPEMVSLSSMLRRVFTTDPNFRPTARQVLTDAWFRQFGLGI